MKEKDEEIQRILDELFKENEKVKLDKLESNEKKAVAPLPKRIKSETGNTNVDNVNTSWTVNELKDNNGLGSGSQKEACEFILQWHHRRNEIVLGFDMTSTYGNVLSVPENESEKVFMLTGLAGTGKTYLAKAITAELKSEGRKVAVCAPAHTAREHIGSICNTESHTLASLLGKKKDMGLAMMQNKTEFIVDGEGKAESHTTYIIDECSMINEEDIYLIRELCERFTDVAVILMGDIEQILPVGSSTPSIAFNIEPTYLLTEQIRQDKDNPINSVLKPALHKTKKSIIDIYLENNIFVKKANGLYKTGRKYTWDMLNGNSNFVDYLNKSLATEPEGLIERKGKNQGYAVLDNRKFKKFAVSSFLDERFEKDFNFSRIIARTNKRVREYNNLVAKNKYGRITIGVNDIIMAYENLQESVEKNGKKSSRSVLVNSCEYKVDYNYKLHGEAMVELKPILSMGEFDFLTNKKIPAFIAGTNKVKEILSYGINHNNIEKVLEATKTEELGINEAYNMNGSWINLINMKDKKESLLFLLNPNSYKTFVESYFLKCYNIVEGKYGKMVRYKSIHSSVNSMEKIKLQNNWEKYYSIKNSILIKDPIWYTPSDFITEGKIQNEKLVDSNRKTINVQIVDKTIDFVFAITSHKCQGHTYTNSFVDYNDLFGARYFTNAYLGMLTTMETALTRSKDGICYINM